MLRGAGSLLFGFPPLQKAGGGGAWSPLDEETLYLWLSADSGVYADALKTTPPSDGAAIEAWVARGAADTSYDFLKDGAGATPTYIANATNGKPAVRFDAASQQYLLAASSTLQGVTGPVTVVTVAKTTRTSHSYIFGKLSGSYSNMLNFSDGFVGFKAYNQWQNSTMRLPTAGNTVFPEPRMVSVVHDSAQDANFYLKTHLKETIAGTAVFLGVNAPMYLGRQAEGYYYTGDMYELLIFAEALSAEKLEQLRAYFAAKYSLQSEWWMPPFDPDAFKGTWAASPLTIPTYDGSGQAMHPSVVYVPGGWNGYEYWMAFTPYPGSDVTKENPSIVASNDKVTWVVPDGLTNPIEPQPPSGGENSDPDLWYDEDTETMYCLWRKADSPSPLYYRKSTDGVNWTDKTLVLETPTHQLNISPCLNRVGGTFYLHTWNHTASVLQLRTATSLTGPWSEPVNTTITSGWHFGIKYFDGAFIEFPSLRVSQDGIHWYDGPVANVLPSTRPSWITAYIYRATGVKHANSIDLWYSGQDGSNVWNTGYSELT